MSTGDQDTSSGRPEDNGDKNNLLLFFDRPMEPCFTPKGDANVQKVLDVPHDYYPDKYKKPDGQAKLSMRSGGPDLPEVPEVPKVPVANIALPPALKELHKLPYYGQFSIFAERHRYLAAKLISVFMGMRNVNDLISISSYCQLNVNPYLLNYCLSVAILHRRDCKGLVLPTYAEIFPDKFVHPKTMQKARELSVLSSKIDKSKRMPITIPHNYTASEMEPEQLVAYFREDIGVNLHHWHWHLVYPFDVDSENKDIVNKNRRGELFYYMHQQIIARYNVERLCNGLEMVKPYEDFQEPIKEGYFPKLNSTVAGRAWPPRFANTKISDLDRRADQIKAEVNDLIMWRKRFLEAITNKTVKMHVGPGIETREVPLDDVTGINTLGNMMEASILSPNRSYYGNLHNMGHNFLSYAHDPDGRFLESPGVMGESATAMRDPVFYRWHAHIDDLFHKYKFSLDPYREHQLSFPRISVKSIAVQGGAGANRFATRWKQSPLELKRGVDFTERLDSVQALFTHLQHDEFEYVIEVENSDPHAKKGMFRIFMAPKEGADGHKLRFEEQRRLMIELDKFSRELKPGKNTIKQSSVNSSVTIPFERTFRDQSQRSGQQGSKEAAGFDFCGCGWPHHMLLPKGTLMGYPVVLFCMVSNYATDKVDQEEGGSCNDAASYCGIRDRLYPDRRAMGYPFDRRARSGVDNLDEFLTPNMAVQDCLIKFTDDTTQRQQTQQTGV